MPRFISIFHSTQDRLTQPNSTFHSDRKEDIEARQASLDGKCMKHTMSAGLRNQFVEASASAIPATGRKLKSELHIVNREETEARRANLPGVSSCYIFKSRLQEYAQKVGLSTPVYETNREGPSHEPSFTSTVIVAGVRYESLPGFTNRKAAEQSAAEVALIELSKAGDKKEAISVPVHETGLCKNLLQEYAQKMNYAIPVYVCQKDDTSSRMPIYSCTVDVGGIQYIGAAARTKKEAEIKAARTAMLAIQSSGSIGGARGGETHYTVVPCKRKVPETALPQPSLKKAKKPKKCRCKKKPHEQMHPEIVGSQSNAGNMSVSSNGVGTEVSDQQQQEGLPGVFVPDSGHVPQSLESSLQANDSTNINQPDGQASAVECSVGPELVLNVCDSQATASNGPKGNLNMTESRAPFTDVYSSGDICYNISEIISPSSVQSDALLMDTGFNQGSEVPTLSCVEYAGDGNNGQLAYVDIGSSDTAVPFKDADICGNIPERNSPTSVQSDALLLDSAIDQGNEVVIVKCVGHAGDGNNGHVANDIISNP